MTKQDPEILKYDQEKVEAIRSQLRARIQLTSTTSTATCLRDMQLRGTDT